MGCESRPACVQLRRKGEGQCRAGAMYRTLGESTGGMPRPALQDQGRLLAGRGFLLSQDLTDQQALVTGGNVGETGGKR